MKKYIFVVLVVGVIASLSLPVVAQEDPGPFPVSGSFNYMYEELAALEADGSYFGDYVEYEEWSGDIEGTAVAPFPFILWASGEMDAWLLAEFEGTVLGEYEGTMVIMSIYHAPTSGGTDWHGEWMIISGTGDLEHLRGQGVAWGPGSTNEDDGITDIYYNGQVMFLEPATDG